MANASSEMLVDQSGDQEPYSTLSYECVDDMTLPAIDRGGTKYIALQMAKTGLLSKYADSVVPPLAAQYKWRIRRMTSAEANLLNAAKKDCSGECCRAPFTTDDILVDLPSFLRFYDIVRDCVMLASTHPAALSEGGWLQVNNAVCPYVWRTCIRYVPLVIINLAAEVSIGGADGGGEVRETDGSMSRQPTLTRVTSSELTFLNSMCTRANQNFRFDSSTDLVSLIDVKLASDAVIFDLPPSSDPFDYALFLGRMDAETVAAGKLAVKAGWDKFHQVQQARISPSLSESSAAPDRAPADEEEPVIVEDSDSSEVIVLSPATTAADDCNVPVCSAPAVPASSSPAAVSSSPGGRGPEAQAAGPKADVVKTALAAGRRDLSRDCNGSTLAAILSAPLVYNGADKDAAQAAFSASGRRAAAAAASRHRVGARACSAASAGGCGGSSSSSAEEAAAAAAPSTVDATTAAAVGSDTPAVPAAPSSAAAAAGASASSADDFSSASPGAVSVDSGISAAAAAAAAESPSGGSGRALAAGSPDVRADRGRPVLPSPSPDSGFMSPLPSPPDRKGAALEPVLPKRCSAAAPKTSKLLPMSELLKPADASVERLVAQYAVLEPIVRERHAQGLNCDSEVLRLLVWFVHIQQQLFVLLRQQLLIVQRLRGHDRALVGECELVINDMLSNTRFWLSRRHELSPRTRSVLHHTLTCAVLQRHVQSHLNYLVAGLFYVETPAAFENFTFLRNLVALALITSQGAAQPQRAQQQQPLTAYTIVERCKGHLLRHVTAWSSVRPGDMAYCRDSLQAWWAALTSVYTQVYRYADERAAAAAAACSLESDMLLQQQLQPAQQPQPSPQPAAAAAAAAAAATVRTAAAWWPLPGAAAAMATPAGFGASGQSSAGCKATLNSPKPAAAAAARAAAGGHLDDAFASFVAAAMLASAARQAATSAISADCDWAKRRAVSGPQGGATAAAAGAPDWGHTLSTAPFRMDGNARRKTPQAAAAAAVAAAADSSQLGEQAAQQPAAAGLVGLSAPATEAAGGGRPAHTVHYAALGRHGAHESGSSSSSSGGGSRRPAGGPTAVFCVHPLNGVPTPCIARGPDKEWWVLVRDAAHALFPECTVDEFQLVLEVVLRLELVTATPDDMHVLSMARVASAKPGSAAAAAAAEWAGRGCDGYGGCSLLVRCRSLVEHAQQLRTYLSPGAGCSGGV